MAEMIDGGDRSNIPRSHRESVELKREVANSASSHSTEKVLRDKCDREIRNNPGEKSSILGKYRKY